MTVLKVILEGPVIFVAIDPGLDALPVLFVVLKLANIYAAIRIYIPTTAILIIILERPVIFIAGKLRIGAPGFYTLTSLLAIFEGANVDTAISIGVCALSVRRIPFEHTDIFIARKLAAWPPGFRALPGFDVFFKRTGIYVPIGISINALPLKPVVLKRTNVNIPVSECFGAPPVLRTLMIRPNIFVAIGINIRALPLKKVIFILANIFVAAGNQIQSAFAIEHVIFKHANIGVAIRKRVGALSVKQTVLIRPFIDIATGRKF